MITERLRFGLAIYSDFASNTQHMRLMSFLRSSFRLYPIHFDIFSLSQCWTITNIIYSVYILFVSVTHMDNCHYVITPHFSIN